MGSLSDTSGGCEAAGEMFKIYNVVGRVCSLKLPRDILSKQRFITIEKYKHSAYEMPETTGRLGPVPNFTPIRIFLDINNGRPRFGGGALGKPIHKESSNIVGIDRGSLENDEE